MPTLQQLRYLVAVSETSHFRKAAEKSNVTQPTLSDQIRELERKLGGQLVERSRSRVLMTPLGDEVVARSRRVLRDIQEIVDISRAQNNPFGGTIRIGIPHTLGPSFLPLVLPEIHRAYPSLKLYIRESMPEELLSSLDEGALDILIFPLPLNRMDYEVVRLFREPLYLIVPSDNALASLETVTGDVLRGQTILALEPGHRLHDQVEEICKEYNAQVSLDYEGTSLDTLRQMVEMGMGLTFLPALYVLQNVESDTALHAVKELPKSPSRKIGMVWRKSSFQRDEFFILKEKFCEIIRNKKGLGLT